MKLLAACISTVPMSARKYSGHEKPPSMAARALPTLTEMAVMENDHGRLARNQSR
jgi:hypothetical protein